MVLSNSPSLQEILWNFSRFKDEKQRLTLRDNPHFYADLPTTPEAYGDNVAIEPTEDFRHSDEFYVLTDRLELVHIMTDRDWQSFGNFWCPQNAIIFKGLCGRLVVIPVSDDLPDICGRLKGEKIVKASLRGTRCGLCEQLQPPVSIFPRAFMNRRGLQPIITKECPQMGWKCSIGYLLMHSSIDIGSCICAGRLAPDSLVRCDVTTYPTASANIDTGIAPGPLQSLATNVRATGV